MTECAIVRRGVIMLEVSSGFQFAPGFAQRIGAAGAGAAGKAEDRALFGDDGGEPCLGGGGGDGHHPGAWPSP